MPADRIGNVLSGEDLTCKTSVNQIGLNKCLIPRGCSTLHAMLTGIHAASFSVHVNAGISVQAEVCVCKEKSSERQWLWDRLAGCCCCGAEFRPLWGGKWSQVNFLHMNSLTECTGLTKLLA